MEEGSTIYVHSVESGRLLPSADRWNSIEIDFGVPPTSSLPYEYTPSNYSKSYDFELAIADKTLFKRCIYIFVILILAIVGAVLLATFLHRKLDDRASTSNLPLALDHALSFFDAQKSGVLPKNNTIKFRGDSGLNDVDRARGNYNLVGGFYDSGNNIKFSLPTAYTITVLSWSVIEYHDKYSEVGELEHIMDIIKWGCDYLLKLYVPSDSESKPALLYSQVGSTNDNTNLENDITCWQRPEDMTYARPVSVCGTSASDIAGEIVAALSSASLVFNQNKAYSSNLIRVAESLFDSAKNDPKNATYTSNEDCGGEARSFYNSTSHIDELAWGGTWLFFATGKFYHLKYATETFELAVNEESNLSSRVFDWNNKIAANAVLLTRLLYIDDPGYPFATTLKSCLEMARSIVCSYIYPPKWFGVVSSTSPGGLIFPSVVSRAPLSFAATAAFLSKLYGDYLGLIQVAGGSCGDSSFSADVLKSFARSQVKYILGDNPMKMSYVVGFGDRYPKQVHHRGASIQWDGRHYSCADGKRWKESKDPNPNVLLGAMVAGPGQDDRFFDQRDQPEYTEATIAGNAGLVAALVALLDGKNNVDGGMDRNGIFANIS